MLKRVDTPILKTLTTDNVNHGQPDPVLSSAGAATTAWAVKLAQPCWCCYRSPSHWRREGKHWAMGWGGWRKGREEVFLDGSRTGRDRPRTEGGTGRGPMWGFSRLHPWFSRQTWSSTEQAGLPLKTSSLLASNIDSGWRLAPLLLCWIGLGPKSQ